jgi:hypothetical protein
LIADEINQLIPLYHLGKIQVCFTFSHDQSQIFHKVQAAAANSYGCDFASFKLCLEEARISPSFEREVASKSRVLFPGVTHLQLVESMSDLSSTFKTIFPDVFLPEAFLIFCLDKQVALGTYTFGGAGNTEQNVFKHYNIEYLDFSFDNKRFSLKEPHFGKYCLDRLTLK